MIAKGDIDFLHVGIGQAVASTPRLLVPPNQREYSWEEEHVLDLLQDFTRAIPKGAYFLGTVVLTRSRSGAFEIADGQQRIATTTILLAAIRDAFLRRKEDLNVESVTNNFLSVIDMDAQDRVPRLRLNTDDHEYFRNRVLRTPDDPARRKCEPRRESHRRIDLAARLAADHVRDVLKPYGERQHSAELKRWVKFLTDGAQVIVLTVPDHLNAFRMFETLNDRGLKTSQADLLKNYLFGQAGDRLAEAQTLWSGMSWVLESLAQDDITVTYLRHLLVARHGAVRERDLYTLITESVDGEGPSLSFLNELGENAVRYAALLNPTHAHWNEYGQYTTRLPRHVEALNELRVTQIRPLMLACMMRFPPKELDVTFRACIWWAVRFMVAGSPTGSVEKYYAGRAAEVWDGTIKDATALSREMNKYLPSDDTFKAAFTALRVPKAYIARYLLRSLEHAKQADSAEPEWVCNDDQNVLNLEHILPRNPGPEWGNIDADTADQYHRRLGNMVLLRATANSAVGNNGFEAKKLAYRASSTMELTRTVLTEAEWGPEEIERRQAQLAEIAVQTWPLVAPAKQKRKARGSNPSGT